MFTHLSYSELKHLQNKKSEDLTHQIRLAILRMDILEFYALLKEAPTFKKEQLEEFVLKIHRKFAAHQFFGDHELTLVIEDSDISNHQEITCDFQGWHTGFSTKLIFNYDDQQLVDLQLIEDTYDIEKVIDFYTIEQLEKKVFIHNK